MSDHCQGCIFGANMYDVHCTLYVHLTLIIAALSHIQTISIIDNVVMYPGIMLESAEGEKIGESKIAARQGISMVILSRIGMATPGMVRCCCF